MAIPTGTGGETRPGAPALTPERREISRVHRQHVDIVRHLHDLASRLASLDGPSHPGELRNDVAGRLARLQSELAEHFAEEERVGFLPQAAAQEPRLTARARHILSQHDLLRVELSNVVTTLARGTADWGQVRESFESFRAQLRDHEKLESELINEAYLDDLGGGS